MMKHDNQDSKIKIGKRRKEIAYFTMEIGIDPEIPTYSGGLGILAGDFIRSCADLQIPMIAVSLLYKKGYFHQSIDNEGHQMENPEEWDPEKYFTRLDTECKIRIEGHEVKINAWQYQYRSYGEYHIPIIFLDTDIKENREQDRMLSYYLYGGDQRTRLAQERNFFP